MTQQQVTTGTNGITPSEDTVKHVPLTDIFADTEWNARSAANTISEIDTEASQDKTERFAGLKASLHATGQDEPIVLRSVQAHKTLGGHKTDKPYELIAGFRRFAAITALNTDDVHKPEREGALIDKRYIVPNTPNGTIRAVVRNLNPLEARSVNLRENTARNNLDTPDLVFGIRELSYVQKMSEVAIRNQLNISQSWANQLIRLAGIDRKILEHWRKGEGDFEGVASKSRVPVSAMIELAKLKPDQWTDEYKRLLTGRAAGEEGDKQWIEAGKRKAEALGKMLGQLEKAGFMKLTHKVPFVDMIEAPEKGRPILMVSAKKDVKRAVVRKWADVAEKAYTKALNEEKEEEGDEEEGE